MVFVTKRLADTELGLVFRNRVFQKFLGPGEALSVWSARPGLEVLRLDLTQMPQSNGRLAQLYLSHPNAVREWFSVVDMADDEVGVVSVDGKIVQLVSPGKRVFYAKAFHKVTVEVLDANSEEALPSAMAAASQRLGSMSLTRYVLVPSDHVGLMYVDGVMARQLAPGAYRFFEVAKKILVTLVDLRAQTLEVTGQDVLTRDRVGVRVNVTAVYRIIDPQAVVSFANDYRDYLYKALQFALRQVIGARTLEEVLGDKLGINQAIAEQLSVELAETGMQLRTVGVKDIILPGEIRTLMNRVIEAEKIAQANVIRRREETAATRSLLNTAKLMEDNPILVRLKELEALERVSEKVGNVVVTNGMDGVLDNLVRIHPKA